jgi:hypothetical protein
MPHSQIKREISSFANEIGYFPTDLQIAAIQDHFERAVRAYLAQHPGASLRPGNPDYDRMLWDGIETVMNPIRSTDVELS